MDRIIKFLTHVLVLAGWIVIFRYMPVQAADVSYYAALPETAETGAEIKVQVSVAENPGLTTLGLRMQYDPDVLSYQKDQWIDALSSGNNRLRLVSDVGGPEGRMLNISMIDSSVYKGSGTFVTLYFKVKKAYTQYPLTLQFRNATDKEEHPITGNAAVTALTGLSDNSGGNREDAVGSADTADNKNAGGGNSGQMKTPADSGNSAAESAGNSGYDKSFKTGIFVWTPVLYGMCTVPAGIAVICLAVVDRLRKHGRREIQDIIGFGKDGTYSG